MKKIISGSSLGLSRSGYSSIMELVSIGKGGVIIPTPGQTEQEYLGQYHNGRHGFITLKQKDLSRLSEDFTGDAGSTFTHFSGNLRPPGGGFKTIT